MTVKIFIDGEYGTTGLQIQARLAKRADLELLSIAQEQRRDPKARQAFLEKADFAILCLPDAGAREAVAMAQNADTRLIDASTAHRTDEDWIFGFKELEKGHSDKIASARKVSNPGCYSTGAIALIRPLIQGGVLDAQTLLSIHAISGYSGGGKGLIAQMEDSEHEQAIDAPHYVYATQLAHKHVPEIQKHALLAHRPIFSPSVGRFPQGMLVQVPLHAAWLKADTKRQVREILAAHYEGSPHVRVVPLEESESVIRLDPTALVGSDSMDLHVFGTDEQFNLIAVLDNLGKGASGACVQSLDLMLGAA